MTTEPTEAPEPTEQPKKRPTDLERAEKREKEAAEIRLNARRREARLRDKRIGKLEGAISVLSDMPSHPVRNAVVDGLLSLRDRFVDQAVPK